MTPAELRQMLDEAAQEGARRALLQLGLKGPQSIAEVQNLFTAWRAVQRGFAWALARAVGIVLLALMALAAWAVSGRPPSGH